VTGKYANIIFHYASNDPKSNIICSCKLAPNAKSLGQSGDVQAQTNIAKILN
jgi:hypothetical protein